MIAVGPLAVVAIVLGILGLALYGIYRIDNTEAARNLRNRVALQHSLDHGVWFYWYEGRDGSFSLRSAATDRAA